MRFIQSLEILHSEQIFSDSKSLAYYSYSLSFLLLFLRGGKKYIIQNQTIARTIWK